MSVLVTQPLVYLNVFIGVSYESPENVFGKIVFRTEIFLNFVEHLSRTRREAKVVI
jgi:hypothetical protein